MKKTILLFISALTISSFTNAQEGKPSVKIFSNFNYDISAAEDPNENQPFKEFEIKRAYLGYSYKIDEKFSTKITFDIGSNSGGSQYTAFLKIASLKWIPSSNLSVNFGMVGTKNFKFMEKTWGRRYIEKSALDKYKWANSADVGVTADYKINKYISVDAQILNGEGYKKTQASNGLFRGGLGLNILIMDNMSARIHQDISPRSSYDDSSAAQTITSAAIAYSSNTLTIGAEMDIMENTNNIIDHKQELYSIYGSYKISDYYTVFGRYDNAEETSHSGSYTIYGIERKMTKGVTIALNAQTWTETPEESEGETTLFLNLEYKF